MQLVGKLLLLSFYDQYHDDDAVSLLLLFRVLFTLTVAHFMKTNRSKTRIRLDAWKRVRA